MQNYCMVCGDRLTDGQCPRHGSHIDDEWIYCGEYGCKYCDDDFHTVWEPRGEFWGAPCSEEIIDYIMCHCCGERYEY